MSNLKAHKTGTTIKPLAKMYWNQGVEHEFGGDVDGNITYQEAVIERLEIIDQTLKDGLQCIADKLNRL